MADRVATLGAALGEGLERAREGARERQVVDALWEAEGLGALLWGFELAPMPPYDQCFELERLPRRVANEARLRASEEIEHARESARLWHWRARTAFLHTGSSLELPASWSSFEQLIAVAALRGHELGLLPAPIRGDFPAYGTAYRSLPADRQLEALSIAYERHRALNWLCGLGGSWAETPTDT